MTKEIKTPDDWSQNFEDITASVNELRFAVDSIAKWIWDNVVGKGVIHPKMPTEISEALAKIDREIRTVIETSDNIRWYFCSQPWRKWLEGQPLTREEYYLLAATGILTQLPYFSDRKSIKTISYSIY